MKYCTMWWINDIEILTLNWHNIPSMKLILSFSFLEDSLVNCTGSNDVITTNLSSVHMSNLILAEGIFQDLKKVFFARILIFLCLFPQRLMLIQLEIGTFYFRVKNCIFTFWYLKNYLMQYTWSVYIQKEVSWKWDISAGWGICFPVKRVNLADALDRT
jgi:hypothetical protein